jgi:hypothetical protein
MPPNSSVGFAPADWALLLITAILLLAGSLWRPSIEQAFSVLARKTRSCLSLLFLLPIVLRILLLPNHPAPTPDAFEEFGNLLVADTFSHGRLANPPHAMPQFFETPFVLQKPTYSSTSTPGMGLMLTVGRLIFGTPWAAMLIACGAFCATCYWMLRVWVPPTWAFLGGILAIIEFGPLCQWTNSYAGGFLAALGGCLVFGALPRLGLCRPRDAILLGVGLGLHLLNLSFESLLLLLAIVIFFALGLAPRPKHWSLALAAVLPAILLVLLHNHAATHSWMTLPEQLVRSPAADSLSKFMPRLEYRVRFYRFFFLPPLYLALLGFLFSLRDRRSLWLAMTLAIFALGTNLFPYVAPSHLAGVTSLFVLASVVGLRRLSKHPEVPRILIVLCLAEFAAWYALHLFESPNLSPLLQYETWDSINHANPRSRIQVQRQLEGIQGPLLVFVRYSAQHPYQNEWIWNNADIDSSRVVFARDLGPAEDETLIRYYPNRRVLLLEPDAANPQLSLYPPIH